jgi:hypothetical protein
MSKYYILIYFKERNNSYLLPLVRDDKPPSRNKSFVKELLEGLKCHFDRVQAYGPFCDDEYPLIDRLPKNGKIKKLLVRVWKVNEVTDNDIQEFKKRNFKSLSVAYGKEYHYYVRILSEGDKLDTEIPFPIIEVGRKEVDKILNDLTKKL